MKKEIEEKKVIAETPSSPNSPSPTPESALVKVNEKPFIRTIHEEPHPQMTGTLSYRPEETGGRQREKSLDEQNTRHRRLDDRYRVLPWPEDCMVVVCLHDSCTVCTQKHPAHRRRRF
ncbi:hypothetical protein TNCV_4765151 [Trichonephila clavipes]|nr:hypothetical protein TNCV_4765151 [Trichonephila clavipes]